MTSGWHLFTGWGRMAIPAGVVIFALLLMTAPLFTPMPATPNLAFLALFVWRVFQPALMPPWLAFAIGIIADLWLALPLGVHAVLLPLFALLIGIVERRYGQRPFAFDWMMAVFFILIYYSLFWQLSSFTGAELRFDSLLVQMLTTLLAYPLVARFCALVQRRWIDFT